VLCSGSSSLDIIQQVEESLAGRVRMINAYSLSFAENVLFKDKSLYAEFEKYDSNTNTSVMSGDIKQVLKDQLLYGGMPRVCLTSKPEGRIQILDDIFKTYLLRDVKSYVRNTDSVGFNKLLSNLAIQTGNLVNINELSRTTGLTYNKCEEYIYLLEQMYIIKMVSPYEANAKKTIRKMKKGDLEFYTSDEILDAIDEYLETALQSPISRNNSWTIANDADFLKDLPTLSTRDLSFKYGVTTTAVYYHKRKLANSRSENVNEISGSSEKLGNRCRTWDGES